MNLGLLILRLVVGLLLAGHGAQKLFGWFGGHGLRGTSGFFDQLGLKPGHLQARAAGALELGGGILLALGLLTPFASMAVIAVMTAAVIAVHGRKGPWATDGGYEYNAVLAAVAFALASVSAGSLSLDRALTLSDHGALWGILAALAGVLGGVAAVFYGRSQAQERHQAPTSPAHNRLSPNLDRCRHRWPTACLVGHRLT
jgi:putative oxidoreductase